MGIDISPSNWSHLVISLHTYKTDSANHNHGWIISYIYKVVPANIKVGVYIYIYTVLYNYIIKYIYTYNKLNKLSQLCGTTLYKLCWYWLPSCSCNLWLRVSHFCWRNLAKAGKGHQSFPELIRDWSILYTPRHPGLVSDLFVLGQTNDLDICYHWTLFFAVYPNFRIGKQLNHVKTPCLMLMSPLFTRSRMGQSQFLLGKSLLNP